MKKSSKTKAVVVETRQNAAPNFAARTSPVTQNKKPRLSSVGAIEQSGYSWVDPGGGQTKLGPHRRSSIRFKPCWSFLMSFFPHADDGSLNSGTRRILGRELNVLSLKSVPPVLFD